MPEETRIGCDRVVFTSLPSPTGEGYRVVACSPGLRSDERSEITRRSPSHDSLCSPAPSARGLAISTLKSGRVCVSLSRLAGAEHTGRGGERVWTDALLVDAADFLGAGGLPDAFEQAVAAAPLPAVKLSPIIDKLWMSPPLPPRPAWSDPGAVPTVTAQAALAALLLERAVCVVACPDPVALVEGALALLPRALRGGLSVSAGLRFANSRQVTACVVDQIDVETRRVTRGRPVALLSAEELAARPLGLLTPWFRLMKRWYSEGRQSQALELAYALHRGWSPPAVLEVTAVCEAIDRREESPDVLSALLARRAAT